MTIEWNPSAGPTLGVEWEVQLVDAQTRLLRQDAGTVLAGLPGLLESGEHPKMRHELMQSPIEVVPGICGTVAEAKADLALSLKDLQRAAEPHGIVLASSGTHAISHWRDAKMAPSQRYAELVQEIQYPSRRLQTMAVHVHVGLRDEHRAMPVINALAVYLPHLLGLSSSSPYWCGEDTGLASSRSIVFGSLPHAGPPLGLPDWRAFEGYMAGQLRAGTIPRPPTSARWRCGSRTRCPPCARSACSPRSSSAWCTCSTRSLTGATNCRPARRGSSPTTSGGGAGPAPTTL